MKGITTKHDSSQPVADTAVCAHPSIDNLRIVELKRRKLLIKDEIARLQTLIADANMQPPT